MKQSVRMMGRTWAVRGIAILLGAVGGALLLVNALHNRRHDVTPVRLPLRMAAGEVAEARFLAESDGPYEIEIAAVWSDASAEPRKILAAERGPSPLDLKWEISADGNTIARGDCRDYRYVSSPSVQRRIHDRLLGIAPRAPLLDHLVARGVGRFRARAGTRYEIRAEVGGPLPPLDAAAPSLIVRVDRLVWHRHTRQTLTLAHAGVVALGLAGIVALSPGAVALTTRMVRRGRAGKG